MPTKRDILLRAIYARRATARPVRRVMPRVPLQRFPREVVLSYKKKLLAIVRANNQAVREILFPELERWFPLRADSETIRTDADPIGLLSLLDRIKSIFADTDERASAAAFVAAKNIERINKSQIKNQFKTVLGADVSTLMPDPSRAIEHYVARNVTLIKSIGETRLSELHEIIVVGQREGLHVQSIKDEIESRFEVSESKASLIARDQVGKLNGQLTKDRQTELGVSQYIWRTLRDERVRGDPSGKYPDAVSNHYLMDERYCSWEDPPLLGTFGEMCHPQEDVNCRCIAEPVLDALFGASEGA